jgi:hypothetical protein
METPSDRGRYLPADDAVTRSELLASRGYPPDIIQGNGHAARIEPEVVPVEPSGLGHLEQGTSFKAAKVCRGCGSPTAGRMWCSNACRKRAQHAALKAAASAPVEGSEVEGISRDTGVTRISSNGPIAINSPPDLLGDLSDLSARLAPGWRAELAVGSVTLKWAGR